MANRNSTSLVLPGNPLGSVLRETAREARRSNRDPNAVQLATQADFEALQATVESLQDAVTVLQRRMYWTIGTTAPGGIGSWVYPTSFVNTPVILASPIGGIPYFCVVNSPTNVSTQFIVWDAASVGQGGVQVGLLAISQD